MQMGITVALIIGWVIAVGSLCFNVYQWRHGRRTKVKAVVKCHKGEPSATHCRWLMVDIENIGTALNDMSATLEYPLLDGTPHVYRMEPVGITPNPLAYGFSCRFATIANEDPATPVDVLLKAPLDQMRLIIHSGVREVLRLPAKKWEKQMLAYANPDPDMPRKPPPNPQQIEPDNWITYRGRW